MSVDPQTLRAGAIERLTIGPGLDTQLSLSADGKKLAFTGESKRIRAWLFPFDATLDLSAGGFSTFVPVALRAGEVIGFVLGLGSGDLQGRARVMNVLDEGTSYRVSFKLEGVRSADSERMETEVLDAALQQFEFFASHS